ncbi:protein of unknown function [Kyrpidia spormannii]|uniref:Uncharacterized protein n=1 Tax=Kyrpidia spormannii TaxID=2055160 RepID=A0A6F9EG65_9BACL|nr:protein of unknown function [Kyrpidia spormannii]
MRRSASTPETESLFQITRILVTLSDPSLVVDPPGFLLYLRSTTFP